MAQEYLYRNRAVAFLDVLGFRQKLTEFENEARANRVNAAEGGENSLSDKFISKKANEFINTFKKSIDQLDNEKYRCYLFSDNICITSRTNTSTSDLEDLLVVISKLYFDFVQQGYFLRGGVDYGLFVDSDSIAVGVPLATAYELESKFAVFPRIVLSSNCVRQFEVYSTPESKELKSPFVNSLIKTSCEITYLNVFNHIFKVDDKEGFFTSYNSKILEHLAANKNRENVFLKFDWLAKEFNSFIEAYTTSLAYLDEYFEPSEEYLDSIKQLKLTHGN